MNLSKGFVLFCFSCNGKTKINPKINNKWQIACFVSISEIKNFGTVLWLHWCVMVSDPDYRVHQIAPHCHNKLPAEVWTAMPRVGSGAESAEGKGSCKGFCDRGETWLKCVRCFVRHRRPVQKGWTHSPQVGWQWWLTCVVALQ